jgi:hypothetical protein
MTVAGSGLRYPSAPEPAFYSDKASIFRVVDARDA